MPGMIMSRCRGGASKLFRSFLWWIVSNPVKHAALVRAGKETLMSLRSLHRVDLVISAMDANGRDTDFWQGGQLRLDRCVAGIAGGIVNTMHVRVDHNIHKIWVVE